MRAVSWLGGTHRVSPVGRTRGDSSDRFCGRFTQSIFPILAISSSQILVSSSISWFYYNTRKGQHVIHLDILRYSIDRENMLHCASLQAKRLELACRKMRKSLTFCCSACSRDSFFICSFLKPAVSAVFSELAFVRT